MSTPQERRFERTDRQVLHEGRILTLTEETFRREDGAEFKREIVRTGGSVGILAHDGTDLLLVRQPREAIGDPDSLEVPAGRLDKPGEDPIECARREIQEEIGFRAEGWRKLCEYQPSVGILDETIHLYAAWDLHPQSADSGEDERIEVVRWPIADLAAASESVRDAKTLIALLWVRANGLPGAG